MSGALLCDCQKGGRARGGRDAPRDGGPAGVARRCQCMLPNSVLHPPSLVMRAGDGAQRQAQPEWRPQCTCL